MGKKNHELIPSARRLISSLRDMGYDFPSAVADIVDNSIEAGALRVSIDIRGDGDESWVRITDDGRGMKPAEVREALRFGSTREYDKQKSLGKFGLGLKTASMSQCQHLLVASRSNPNQPQICAYSWDLAHILETDTWQILDVRRDEYPALLHEPLMSHTGTVVLWRRLDRMLGSKSPYAGMIKKRILGLCEELEEHLAMVFHRYIAGEAGRRKVRITVNGKAIRAWDPFVRTEKGTICLDAVPLQYDHDGIKGTVILEPYVLPHQEGFSSQEAHAEAAGSLRWNRQQGFYIYRADRMVQNGGWSNIRTLDEHTKLARIAMRFDPMLDEAFRINVAKMRVEIPRQLREQIEQAIAPVIKIAQATYRRYPTTSKAPAQPGSRSKSSHVNEENGPRKAPTLRAVNLEVTPVSSNIGTSHGNRSWTIEELRQQLEKVATSDERRMLMGLFTRLAKAIKEAGSGGPLSATRRNGTSKEAGRIARQA